MADDKLQAKLLLLSDCALRVTLHEAIDESIAEAVNAGASAAQLAELRLLSEVRLMAVGLYLQARPRGLTVLGPDASQAAAAPWN